MDAFISYSHHDSSALERLHVHLAVLRRDGLIREWFDRDILAGEDLDGRIADKLESSSLFLLIITPDFLNSDYCVEREMARALERQKAGEARVIGIIVEPCDWQSTPLRAIKVLPSDGKPVAEWTNANSAWLNVVQEIRRAILEDHQVGSAAQARDATFLSVSRPLATASRYRAKRDFDDIDRSEFRERAFEEIEEYFKQASSELDSLDDFRARVVDISPTAFGCTIVNRALNRGTAHLTVHRQTSSGSGMGDIYWSFEENAASNSANGWLSIENDEFELFLKAQSFSFGWDERRKMSWREAASSMWNDMLQRAGIAHA